MNIEINTIYFELFLLNSKVNLYFLIITRFIMLKIF